jgi:hypothetical protein
MMILTGANSQLVYQSALAAPSTGWFSASKDISGSHQYCLVSDHPRHLWREREVGEGNENLVYPVPWDFKEIFYVL